MMARIGQPIDILHNGKLPSSALSPISFPPAVKGWAVIRKRAASQAVRQ